MYIGSLIAGQIYKLRQNMIDESIEKQYGNRLRVRVAGLCIKNEKILLVNHAKLNEENEFWSPPGGGLIYGESVIECLHREFLEETGLQISVKEFQCVMEYLKSPLHAIELFFKVTIRKGTLQTGFDPESRSKDQIIKNVEFLSLKEILKIPHSRKHNILHNLQNFQDLITKTGYSKFP